MDEIRSDQTLRSMGKYVVISRALGSSAMGKDQREVHVQLDMESHLVICLTQQRQRPELNITGIRREFRCEYLLPGAAASLAGFLQLLGPCMSVTAARQRKGADQTQTRSRRPRQY
jgi:hypothetical protein